MVSPLPVRVTAWPGLADATPAFAGVPLIAVPTIPVSGVANAALVPPCVVTEIGPKAPASGTVRLTAVPGR